MGIIGWDEAAPPEAPPAPPPAAPNSGGIPGSTPGSMTGPTNTGVPTTNQPGQVTSMPMPKAADASATGASGPWSSVPGLLPSAGAALGFGNDVWMNGAPQGTAASSSSGDKANAPDQQFQTQLSGIMQKLSTTTDPTQKAQTKDELARTVSQQLTSAGHDVKWQGDTLMVDGRPYTVAGGNQTNVAGQQQQAGGGNLSDPAYVDQLLAKWAQQPGVNPSVINDPGYWKQKILSGAFGNDEAYLTSRFMTPEGAPAGGGVGSFASSTPGLDAQLAAAVARPTGGLTLAGQRAAGGIQQPNLPTDLANWRPSTGPLYTPGEIGFGDIDQFSRESMLKDITGDPTSMASQSLINRILQNPESMDQHTTDTMKASMKDTLAEQQKQEEEDMQRFGSAAGIGDSNWLASQKLASRRGRDIGVAKANQDVDIQAAKQNSADRMNAAGIGLQAQSARQTAVSAATSASLQKSAVTGDRLALRESVKQKAAELQISEDQVMSNFVLDKEKNLLTKYGIDLGAQIDVERLNQADKQHKEDLMQKMAALEQTLSMQDQQFGAGLQFQNNTLQNTINEQNWQHQYLTSLLPSKAGGS